MVGGEAELRSSKRAALGEGEGEGDCEGEGDRKNNGEEEVAGESEDESSDESEDGLAALCDFSSSSATAAPAAAKKRKLDVGAMVSARWRDGTGALEDSFAESEAARGPARAPSLSPPPPEPTAAAPQTANASERPAPRGQHKFDNVPARSRCPKAKKDGGKPRTFNAKERASRTKRGDNDYVQEEKRILRQTTDGFSMGY